jgi:hypothetical protein
MLLIDIMTAVTDQLASLRDWPSNYARMFQVIQPPKVWMRDASHVQEIIRISDRSIEIESCQWSIPILGYRPAWFQDSVNTMLDLMQLEDNWNGHGAMPLQQEFAEQGIRILWKLENLISSKPFLYPSASGGLVAEIDRPSGRITLILDDGLAIIFRQGDEKPTAIDLSREGGEAELLQALSEALRR